MYATEIPNGRTICLVDNVYSTGATARAAMDALGVECEVVVYAYDETKNNLKTKSIPRRMMYRQMSANVGKCRQSRL